MIAVLVQVAALLFALRTSLAPRRAQAVTVLLVAVAAVAAIISPTIGRDSATAVRSAVSVIIAVAALAAISSRVARHLTVSGETLLAAVSAYLLIGMTFASIFGLVEAVDSGPFFVGVGDGSWVDRVYFSFATMTTVGYGDLVPATDLGRMLAITEALIGQLFLVSVVALVVGNLGRTRRPRGGGDV